MIFQKVRYTNSCSIGGPINRKIKKGIEGCLQYYKDEDKAFVITFQTRLGDASIEIFDVDRTNEIFVPDKCVNAMSFYNERIAVAAKRKC